MKRMVLAFTIIVLIAVIFLAKIDNILSLNANIMAKTNLVSPVITSISPSVPLPSNSEQNIIVNGNNFVSGLVVMITLPNGSTVTLSGSQIVNVTSTSFTIRIILNMVGTWCFKVVTPNGDTSIIFCFTVAGPVPTISSISPLNPCSRNGDQVVVVNGTNFQSGLTANVNFPTGGGVILSGSQIQNVTPTSFSLIVTLNLLGQYSFRVTNPGGVQSNQFSFSTQNCVNVTSISPSIPIITNIDQFVDVSGSNYQPGLTVTVFFPIVIGGSTTLSGSQIQNVTPTSFRMIITLNVLGEYGMRVNNPDGTLSQVFNFSTRGQGDFSISPLTTSRTISRGMSATFPLAIQSTGGFNVPVGLLAINLPNNQALPGTGFTPQTVIPPTNGSANSILTIVTNNETPTGNFVITIRGISGGLIRETPITLRINPTAFDFDSDGETDLSIFRPSNGQWWFQRSSDNITNAYTFGTSTDKIVPSDYDGDGKTDCAFFRPSTGEWYVLRSSNQTFFSAPFGTSTDIPAPGDFDMDGKTDFAVYRPSSGTWFISKTTGGVQTVSFGTSGDIPVVADYDNDGKADVAVFRPTGGSGNAEWWILKSGGGVFATPFGSSTDKPVQGDYTGDGKADAAFWRPSTGEWFVLRSENLTYYAAQFGVSTDIPVPGDYDGDGKFDFAVFRPSNVTWFIMKSTGGIQIQAFGAQGDKPVSSAFVP